MSDSSIGPGTNVVLGVGVVGLSVAGLIAADTLPTGLRVDPLGPAYYPRFVFSCMGVLGLALTVASLRDVVRARRLRLADPEPLPQHVEAAAAVDPSVLDTEPLPPVSHTRMAAVLGLCLAYVLLLEPLGYVVSTFAFIVLLLPLLRVRQLPIVLACAVATPLVLDALFGRLLGVPLPGGVLNNFSGFLPG